MSPQPENCPKPQGECPYDQQDVGARLARIEVLLNEDKDALKRHCDHITSVLDQQFLNLEEHRAQITWLEAATKSLLNLMEGTLGRPGLVQDEAQIKMDVRELQLWKLKSKAFIAGVAATASLVGTGIGVLITVAITWLTRR